MAVIPWAVESLPEGKQYPTGIRVIKWVLPSASDTGEPYYAPQFSGKAVQLTAGAGTVTMEGTLVPEGVTAVWSTLHDPASADLVLATNEIRQVLEDCYGIRPSVATNGATVYLFVTTTARR